MQITVTVNMQPLELPSVLRTDYGLHVGWAAIPDHVIVELCNDLKKRALEEAAKQRKRVA